MNWPAARTEEGKRLLESADISCPWRTWGPYLSERQWGTVREDYSAEGAAWDYLPHDHARSRAYRWGEDGLLGISDDNQILCFGIALWNHKDPILKERPFGLTNSQGNHGEDVKELYYFLDATPTASYLKGLYKYPQTAYPYEDLVQTNGRRSHDEREYEIWDTGVFNEGRYFDVQVEYAKDGPYDIYVRISVTNHGSESAPLTLLPQLWFRNRWSWNDKHAKPILSRQASGSVKAQQVDLGDYTFDAPGADEWLFTENNTNEERIFGAISETPFVKDAFHRAIVEGELDAVNPDGSGTKCAAVYRLEVPAGKTNVVILRLGKNEKSLEPTALESLFHNRILESSAYYEAITPGLEPEVANVQRQAFASLIWSKQFYHLSMREWLNGDPKQPVPPAERKTGRNRQWWHFDAHEILAMPDTWEYPWFAAWDLAFHCVTYALIDPAFAKEQLILLTREWYMHPNGQLPAYEWAFGDVNPPVHAWAAWRVYSIERRATGIADREFLARIFHKLLINFTWWINRKDSEGNNVFEGGFLGLDNIGVFDRNVMLGEGITLEQSDATSWMGMFCLNMLTIALELAAEDPAYEDVATKFLEHFFYIANAMNSMGSGNLELWDEEDGFYYDLLRRADGSGQRIKVRTGVGLIPLFAVTTLGPDVMTQFPAFHKRLQWFLSNRPEYLTNIADVNEEGVGSRRVLSLVPLDRLKRVVARMTDEREFLSPHGLRALSAVYRNNPYTLEVNGVTYSVDYQPAESKSGTFGGNSNWRGPIWFPINYLVIESLQVLDFYYGKMDLSMADGYRSLDQIALDLERRLISLFLPGVDGQRPCLQEGGPYDRPENKDLLLFHEYFDGDTGRGLGASHQTGWTALIAKIIQQYHYTHTPGQTSDG